MTETLDKRTLLARLEPFGQQHLLQYWEELSQTQRRELAAQIEAVDLKRIDSLFRGELDQADWDQLSRRAEPPPAVLQLGAGEHRIECKWNTGTGKTVHKTVLVREGQTHSVHFRDDEETTDDPS